MAIIFSQGTRANIDHYNIGLNATNFAAATSFVPAANDTITSVSAYIEKVGSPSDSLIPYIYPDVSGVPGSVALATGTAFAGITTTYTFISTPLSLLIISGVKYWLVLYRSGANDPSNYYNWSLSSSTGGTSADQNGAGQTWETNTALFDAEVDGVATVPTVLSRRSLLGVGI